MFDVLGRIKELREARHWSVYKLAQLSGIPQSTIATWYQKNLYPPIDKIEILCNTFGITLEEFFAVNDKSEQAEDQQNFLYKWTLLTEKERNALLVVMDTFLSQDN